MDTYPSELEEKLGFDVIRSRLEENVGTPLGRERLDSLRPARSLEALRTELTRVEELQAAFQYDDAVPLDNFHDLRGTLRRAAPEEAYVDPEELWAVRLSLITLRRLQGYFEQRRSDYPRLAQAAGRIVPVPDLEEHVLSILNEDATVRDDASPELARLRRQIRAKENELRDTLDAALRNAIRQGYATEEQATLRGGRMVIPVRAEAKRKVEGFVHDTSASGQTVYIEPAACLELNNEVRELKSAEQREVERILREATAHLRSEREAMDANLRAMAQFDLLQAKARLADHLDAVVPKLNEEGRIELYEGRNPVLELHFQSLGAAAETEGRSTGEDDIPPREVVPLNMVLGEDFRTLVITGPNAGGKTVTMKTVGLFALMLGYGLPLPVAPHSSFPLFDQIMADIGDEQSIEDDLSTFSSHVSNLRHMLAEATDNSLVLIDEAGTGTDPDEGGALAQAVLERLTAAGARTIATTHHGTLKVYAHETEGVENGSMEFDQETLRPTYRYQEGVPGSSYAFEIAERMGLDAELLDRARMLAGEQKTAMENLISTFEERTQRLENELYEAEKKKEQAEAERTRLEEKRRTLEKERESIRQQALEEAERIVDEANARIERTIREIKEAQAASEATQEARAELEDYKEGLDDERAQAEEAAEPEEDAPSEASSSPHLDRRPDAPIQEGDQVVLDDGTTALEVQEIDSEEAVVLMGSMHMRVDRDRLTKVGEAEPEPDRTHGGNQTMAALEASPSIDVRGQRVDEARHNVQDFLDNAIAAGLDTVEILHGKGTGALRSALHEMLAQRSDIQGYRKAPIQEGGAGVTTVDLS
ncbi:MAG: endonuclease MutS2 [Salinibacter sp.]